MTIQNRAVFLDRDGTINVDYGYIYQIEQFHFIDGVIDACQQLKKQGFLIVIVTNQSGITRGKFTEEQFLQLTEWMDWSFADRGVNIDGVYYCPHYHSSEHKEYNQHCECRKPAPGLLLCAQKELNINMADSYLVGDKLSDIQAGRNAGVGCNILVKSGKPIDAQIAKQADAVISSVKDLPAFIAQKECCKKA